MSDDGLGGPDVTDKEKLMNTALWIVAGLLAAFFLLAGGGKLVASDEKMAESHGAMGWVNDVRPVFVRTLGALEIVGAIGLILPALLDIAPILVPLAALGLATIMAGAVTLRIRRREPKAMLLDLAYLLPIVFVAWGRLGPESFPG
ncbi:DoxX family protein [Kribbella sp. DT2]|uniref:DoxX family protein n=1 Tax=Kribbella sp. DT2 TaxID=3393427 RepID=UPI003CFB606E